MIPRSAFTSTAGMRVASGKGLEKIVAEETADAAAFQRDHDRIENAKQHPWRYALFAARCSGTVPAFRRGRARSSGSSGASAAPATTASTSRSRRPTRSRRSSRRSLRQGGEAGSFEFTATLFDLIRRGVYTSKPVTTERKIWGGLRTERVSDLELSAGKSESLRLRGSARSRTSSTACHRRRAGAALALPREDRGRPRGDEQALHRVQGGRRRPRSARAAGCISRGVVPLVVALLLFVASARSSSTSRSNGWRPVYPRWSDVVLIGARGRCVRERARSCVGASRSGGSGAGARPRPSSRPSAGRRSAAT